MKLSTLLNLVSWRQTKWQEVLVMVALTVALRSGQLSPLTFQLRVLIGCTVMGAQGLPLDYHGIKHQHKQGGIPDRSTWPMAKFEKQTHTREGHSPSYITHGV